MGILDATLTRMMARSVRHVEPLVQPASPRAAEVYAQMRDETGLLPPFLCQAAQPEVLAAAWVAAREAWSAGPVGRLEREAVAAGVSNADRCPFCVEAHTMTSRAGGHGAATRIGDRSA